MPTPEQLEEEARPKGVVKGIISLDRLYKLDVFAMNGKSGEVELVVCFVNKDLSPYTLPIIKRYLLKNDEKTKTFLRQFEQMVLKTSKYYNNTKVKVAE